MKKFVKVLFSIAFLLLFGLISFACDGKYDNMSMSAYFYYSQSSSTQLDDGTIRVSSSQGVFDVNLDGSYTLYISDNSSCSATIAVSYDRVPASFSYGVIIQQDNNILDVDQVSRVDSNVVYTTVRAIREGQARLTLLSVEGDKHVSLYVNVVRVDNALSFKQNNPAMINARGNSIDILNMINAKDNNSITISFGYMDLDVFVPYSLSTLNTAHNLDYNSTLGTLSILGSSTDLDTIVVRVSHIDPFGKIVSITNTISFVQEIKNFSLYLGSNLSDIVEENLISSDSSVEFVLNYLDLNIRDFLLVAENNGQYITFDMSSNPYYQNISNSSIKYLDNAGEEVDDVTIAKYAVAHFRLLSNRKTNNFADKTYSQVFSCNYRDFIVEDYPLQVQARLKTFELISSYLINGETYNNISLDDIDYSDICDVEIYVNGGESYKGGSVTIDLFSPSVLEEEHSLFTLSLLDFNKNILPDFSSLFTLTNSSGEILDFNSTFQFGEVFYIKPSLDSNISDGQVYYLLVAPTEPNDTENKVTCVISMHVYYGISSIDSIDYTLTRFDIDEENGGYAVDEFGNNIIVTESFDDVAFNDFVLTQRINLELTSQATSNIVVNFSPLGASMKTLQYVAEEAGIVSITRDEDSPNVFTISAQNVGKTYVDILSNDLVYKIPVSVYSPITDFYVMLRDSSFESGVASSEVDLAGNLLSTVVKTRTDIALRLSVFPMDTTQYTLHYSLQRLDGEEYLDFENNTLSFRVDEISSEYKIWDGESFVFNCSSNTFTFTNPTLNNKYRLTISVENLNGMFLSRSIEIASYNPSNISIDLSKARVYNSSSLSYFSRIGDESDSIDILTLENDASCFGVRVSQTTLLGNPSYPFSNYGHISFKRNGLLESSFSLSDGILVEESASLVQMASENAINGYYFFKINSTNIDPCNILLEVSLDERFSDRSSNIITRNAYVSVYNAQKVTSLNTVDSQIIEQNVDAMEHIFMTYKVRRENAFDKSLISFNYKAISVGSTTYYVYDENILDVNLSRDEYLDDTYYLSINPLVVGRNRVLLFPQDSIMSRDDISLLHGRAKMVTLSSESEFVLGYFYLDSSLQTPATNAVVGGTYYIKALDFEELNNNFKVYSEIQVNVNDGTVGNEYKISNAEELLSLTKNGDFALKHFILTSDIHLPSVFSSLATYYPLDNLQDYPIIDVYLRNGDNYYFVDKSLPFDSSLQYFGYGFDGTLSGKYTMESATGEVEVKYYGIFGLSFSGRTQSESLGLFYSLGMHAKISDLSLSYDYLDVISSSPLVFGGLAGFSYAGIDSDEYYIKDVSATFENARFTTSAEFTFGSLIGENYGKIMNTSYQTSIKSDLSVTTNSDSKINVGGIVGVNFGEIIGNFDTQNYDDVLLESAGISASVNMNISSNIIVSNSNIGGGVGVNMGSIKNLAIQGTIIADNFDNVGGVVGSALYSERYNNFDNEIYSVDSVYSTCRVLGNDKVGGAIGRVQGDNNEYVFIYYVSAENYVPLIFDSRILVSGTGRVGGVAGIIDHAYSMYCYSISYHDLSVNQYDVYSSTNAGGFAGEVSFATIIACASNMNVSASSVAGLFIASSDNNSNADSCIAYGAVLGAGNKIYDLGILNEHSQWTYLEEENGEIVENRQEDADILSSPYIKSNSNINNGVPYIEIDINGIRQPLFLITPFSIEFNIKNNDSEYINYLKGNSLVLFYNEDSKNLYDAVSVNALNTIKLFGRDEIVSLLVTPSGIKTNRLDIACYDNGVLRINSDGSITLVGKGKANIIISSKLNASYFVILEVSVVSGVNSVGLYDSTSFIRDISENDEAIEVLAGDRYTLYIDSKYNREISFNNFASLDANQEVGIRFKIYNDDYLSTLLDMADGSIGSTIYEISDIIKFASANFTPVPSRSSEDGRAYYYIDVDSSMDLDFTALKSISMPLIVYYTPYINVEFSTTRQKLFLDNFTRSFNISISSGATDIRLADNSSGEYVIYQHESLVFTVYIDTDFEDDVIENNSDLFMDIDSPYYDPNFVLNSTADQSVIYDEQGRVVAISKTFTFRYKDRLGDLSQNMYYHSSTNGSFAYFVININGEQLPLRFYARSKPSKSLDVYLTVASKDNLDYLNAKVYSNIMQDFPQEESVGNVIYNSTTALLSLEVYPYFTSYNRLRVSYSSSSSYSIILNQVEYDANQSSGTSFIGMTGITPIITSNDSMLIEKSTGQDIFLMNTDGQYSYGKNYFFSITIPSSVENKTTFVILIEVLNRAGKVIDSIHVPVISMLQPRLEMSFDDSLMDTNGLYYLPFNTENELFVTTINEIGNLTFTADIEGASSFPNYEAIVQSLLPVKRAERYFVTAIKYNSGIDLTQYIGRKVTISATLGNEDVVSSVVSVSFIITMFTVRGASISGTEDGLLALSASSISPLQVTIDAYYDDSLNISSDNWYNNWYKYTRLTSSGDYLSSIIEQSGYQLSNSFSSYISQLCEMTGRLKRDDISSVFSYVDGEGALHYLQNGASYDEGNLKVELFNNYFSLYSNKVDRRYTIHMILDAIDYSVKLSSSTIYGMPNVKTYSAMASENAKKFTFTDEAIVIFEYEYSFLNPIPVSTAEEFLTMKEGEDYRLVNDIVLRNYIPLECNMASFDGNGYTIYIENFGYSQMQEGSVTASLFSSVSQSSIVTNVTVYYTSKVDETTLNGTTILSPATSGTMELKLYNVSSFAFGGITCVNNGAITACLVTGRVAISLNMSESEEYATVVSSSMTSGLVATNFGTVTNSSVQSFSLSCFGETSGFVGRNSGKIVACFFDTGSITNLSSSNVGGFCYENSGSIMECYVQGKRDDGDNTIQNTYSGISSDGGEVGGFIYNNSGTIADCYSNIKFSSSRISAGFVYSDNASSTISRSYSISYKVPDNNRTTAFPFAGPTTSDLRVEIAGTLNDCYFIERGEYRDTHFYADGSTSYSTTPAHKKATPLSFDNFATHTFFTSYDLALDYSQGIMENESGSTSYNYVDGYTWVIMEGKPVLVSTLVPTFSLQKYLDKTKTFSQDMVDYYVKETGEYSTEESVSSRNVTIKSIFKENGDLAYTLTLNSVNRTYTYVFYSGQNTITLTYSYDQNESDKQLIACMYNDSNILDYEQLSLELVDGEYVYRTLDIDKNFRANDTVEIIYNEDMEIISVTLKVLDSVQYSYQSTTGTRTNPNLIFDYDSFNYYFSHNNKGGHFYRFIADIDLNRNFVNTSYSTLSGIVQGNYMSIDNIYLSYTNTQNSDIDSRAFGVFARVSTLPDQNYNTVISNLSFSVAHIVSHTHDFVGVLAGEIAPYNTTRNIYLSNLSFVQTSDGTGVFGVHSVGAVAGFVSGGVVIKDISSNLSVTAYYQQPSSLLSTMLYDNSKFNEKGEIDVSTLSISGGIVGIFDASAVTLSSTFRNYNASNISVTADGTISGIIVGSAFGVIGENASVNFVNVFVPLSASSYIVATGYGGGLVGENRGKIYASSVTYLNETNDNAYPRSSMASLYNYFYNLSTSSTIAIGGLVGFNNGGDIHNSISTLNVRNRYARIAGGAVGRLTSGKLDRVVSSGNVIARSIMGGLVGEINPAQFMINAGYLESAIVYDRDAIVSVTIESCVAENNFLASDYSYYARSFTSSSSIISSFIGLTVLDVNSGLHYIEFVNNSFYVDGLVSSQNTSTIVHPLSATTTSSNIDDIPVYSSSAIPTILTDKGGNQAVFPLPLEDFYFDNNTTGVFYNIHEVENRNSYNSGKYASRIYSLTNYGNLDSKIYALDFANIDSFYTLITNDDLNGSVEYSNYIGRFGEIYSKFKGQYIKISSEAYFDAWGKIFVLDENQEAQEFDGELQSDTTYYYLNSSSNLLAFSSVKDANDYRSAKDDFYYLSSPVLDSLSLYKRFDVSSGDSIMLVNNDLHSNSFEASTSQVPILPSMMQGAEADRTYITIDGTTYAVLNEGIAYIDDMGKVNYVDFGSLSSDQFTQMLLLYGLNYDINNITEDEDISFAIYNTTSSNILNYFTPFYDNEEEGIYFYYGTDFDETIYPSSRYFRLHRIDSIDNEFINTLSSIEYAIINGIKIPLSKRNNVKVNIDVDNGKVTFFKENGASILSMFDGSNMTEVIFYYDAPTQNPNGHYKFTFNRVDEKFDYTFGDKVYLESNVSRNNTYYSLKISTKRIVFNAFDNGYWDLGDNFYSDSYSTADKYPINKEIADTYVWTDFRDDRLNEQGMIFEIYDEHDLSALAYSVNVLKKKYTSQNPIYLKADLDLSGKYWVPIGTEENPFTGVFTGLEHRENGSIVHTIKYISVNEKSTSTGAVGTLSSNLSLPKYAGLFGYVSYATVSDLIVVGGQVVGEYAGGIAGYAVDSTFINVYSSNTVIGVYYAGGVTGCLIGSDSVIIDALNQGSISLDTSYILSNTSTTDILNLDIYAGGIAGYIQSGSISSEQGINNIAVGISNNGRVSIVDNRTSFLDGTLITLYVGGLFGKAKDIIIDKQMMSMGDMITNGGEINVDTNSYSLYVGGAFGYISTTKISEDGYRINTLQNISNTSESNIYIEYNNNSPSAFSNTVYVGGIAGYSTQSMYRCSNEANITLDSTNYTHNFIVVGGIVGETNPDSSDSNLKNTFDDRESSFFVKECFNFSSISIYSMASYTTVIAGGIVGAVNMASSNLFNQNTEETYVNTYILDCYNLGSIEASNISNVFIAGIAGTNYLRKSITRADSVAVDNVGSFYDVSSDAKLYIMRCMNLANIYVIDYISSRNIIASIHAVDDNNKDNVYKGEMSVDDEIILSCDNYYLKGSAYSSKNVFYAFGSFDDIPSFAIEKDIDQLKSTSTFSSWDMEDVWEQSYSSWYPTLKHNKTSILWENRTESMSMENGVYLIDNADQLSSLAREINNGSLNASSVSFKLTSSIDLSNRYWMPIGTERFPFRGSFDGNGYVIKNLTIDGANVETHYGGLFGYIENATISNLGVENIIIKNVQYAGGIACFAENSLLKYVFTDFSIKDTNGEPSSDLGISATRGAGGIVYELSNSFADDKGLVYSYNNIPVSVENVASISVTYIVGGLVGKLIDSTIYNSYNNYYGTVSYENGFAGEVAGHHALVIGSIEGARSYFVNVFSIASSIISRGVNVSSSPTLYTWDNASIIHITKSSSLPLYNNLAGADDNSIKDIWTNGYSLNPNVSFASVNYRASDFPSLRGLNREWKNDLSEALVAFSDNSSSRILDEVMTYNNVNSNKYSVSLGSNQLGLDGYNNVYTISSAQDLALLSKLVNNSEISTSGSEFILLNDIDLGSMYWTPIGANEEHPFSGIFNFNGHVIYNLTIDATDNIYSGLFGYVSRASIINGYLENAFIRVKGISSMTKTYAGALVGFAFNTSIINVSVTARISGETVSSLYIGGLAGAISGTSSYSIRNVRVYGTSVGVDIKDYSTYIAQERDPSGAESGAISSNSIHVAGISTRSNVYAGGVAGYIEGSNNGRDYIVEYATSFCNVASICLADVNSYVGGISGYATNFVSFNACQNLGLVKSYSNQYDMTGGIVGYSYRCNFSNCSLGNTGYVEGRLQINNSELNYLSFVGGIVGVMAEGVISYCATYGTTYRNYSTSTNVILGAIIGYAQLHTFDDDKVSVYSTSNTGFTDAVGHYELIDDSILSSLFFDNLILVTTPNDIMINTNQAFSTDYWRNDGTLKSAVISLLGTGTQSFEMTEFGLLLAGEGLYIDSNSDSFSSLELQTNSITSSNFKALSYYIYQDSVTGEYKVGENSFPLSLGNTSYKLQSLVGNVNEKTIIIYITIVELPD